MMLYAPPKNEATEDFSPVAPISHRQAPHACQPPLVQRHEFLAHRHSRSEALGKKGETLFPASPHLGVIGLDAPPSCSVPRLLRA